MPCSSHRESESKAHELYIVSFIARTAIETCERNHCIAKANRETLRHPKLPKAKAEVPEKGRVCLVYAPVTNYRLY